jgi:hypothetical protein
MIGAANSATTASPRTPRPLRGGCDAICQLGPHDQTVLPSAPRHVPAPCLFSDPADHDRLSWVRIVVTEVTGHGSIRRGVLDTAWHSDAGRCRDLIEQAGLDVPPPYRPEAGKPIYKICVDDKIVWVASRDLAGPLRELVVMTVLTDRPAAPGPAQGEDQLMQAPPVSGGQAGDEAPGEGGGTRPGAMPARSPDGPGPGDRGVAALPVARRGGRETMRAPDNPGQGVEARGLPNGAWPLAAHRWRREPPASRLPLFPDRRRDAGRLGMCQPSRRQLKTPGGITTGRIPARGALGSKADVMPPATWHARALYET